MSTYRNPVTLKKCSCNLIHAVAYFSFPEYAF